MMALVTAPPVEQPPDLTSSPIFLIAVLYSARRSHDLALEQLVRDRLTKLGIRIVFADEIPPAHAKGGRTNG
jgi:hypothetical protein